MMGRELRGIVSHYQYSFFVQINVQRFKMVYKDDHVKMVKKEPTFYQDGLICYHRHKQRCRTDINDINVTHYASFSSFNF